MRGTWASFRRGGRRGVGPRLRRLVAACALLAPALAAGAAEPEVPAPPPPAVGLDQLLRLPRSVAVEAPSPSGSVASRDQWRTRYTLARTELEQEQKKLEAAQEELQQLAGETSNWQLAAPGGGGGGGEKPLNFRLRQEIRHSREEIERLERRLRDVVIEAELAGVPTEWLTDEARD